jgi:diguanylate cyclase (GGDEF)-like protein
VKELESVPSVQECQELYNIIDKTDIRTVFQPIISLSNCNVIGYEALSRGPKNSEMQNPEVLLNVAKSCNKLLEIEEAFISKAAENIYKNRIKTKIFLNVSPITMENMQFRDNFTKKYLPKYSIDSENIIFEITERDSILTIDNFQKGLEYYREQKCKVAIDDVGSGYSGLNRISIIKPEYLKLDMTLIRNINTDQTKQAIVKAMYELAKLSGSYLIAEGIETEDELSKLIEIGIQYGQGYFIQKPDENIIPIKEEVINKIKKINIKENLKLGYNIANVYISSIAKKLTTLRPNILVSKVDDIFKEDINLLGICVVEDEVVKGVVTRNSFYSKLGWQYGYSIYASKPISMIMNTEFLSVDYKLPIDKVIKLAMDRPKERLYDQITVTKNSKYYGVVTIKDLIEKTIEIEVDNARHMNPLTGLPGNVIIEQNLEKYILSNEKYCVLYFDIDNFKSYNDVYGFESGDKIIKCLAQLINSNISARNFVGHIGGDDFIAIVSSWDVNEICTRIINDFDLFALECYDEQDLQNGYITALNRHGIEEKFPLVSVSIACLTNKNRNFISIYDFAKESSKIKKKCKQNNKSSYIIV